MMLAPLIAGSLILGSPPEIRFDYAPFRGLEVKIGDVAVIESSAFQYYEKGWKQGYFSSAWKPVDIFRGGDGSITVITNSDDGRVANRQVFTPTEKGFKAWAEFRWRGEKPAMLEYTIGRLWAPYVDQGDLTMDGSLAPMLNKPIGAGSTFEQRLYGDGKTLVFRAPAATITFTGQQTIGVMDARNNSIEWAEGKELFWVGIAAQEIQPQTIARFDYEVTIEPSPTLGRGTEEVTLASHALAGAQGPDSSRMPLIPQPKQIQKGGGALNANGGFNLDVPAGLEGDAAWFDRFVSGGWLWAKSGSAVPVAVSVSPSVTKLNGYKLTVDASGVRIIGQSAEGARYGLRTLGQLVAAQNGDLVVPYTTITDWPSAQWRGAHLFVGPTARQFQGKLSDRVLSAMKLNKVVLQCERTKWDTLPGIETSITMPKNELAGLAEHYRSIGMEPIPLIQSMGHMEWFFANQKNLDVAVNPKIPYTLDVRKARGRALITDLWAEVADLMKPKIGHFGLDEIDNRGIDDKNLTTRLLGQGIPLLQGIAQENNMTPMVWSDMFLAKGEAVDAFHAPSVEVAKARRNMLKKGTYVADWHYKNDPQSSTFDGSLELWNSLGFKPIAATWFRPNNIRGFTLSAIKNNAGILQTTWAGYESNEANMIREFDQFAAFIMMADYAWSGRTEMPDQLGYEPMAVLQRLYFGERQSVHPRDGYAFAPNALNTTKIGQFKFNLFEPKQLNGVTTTKSFSAPHNLVVPINSTANELVLAVDCLATINEVANAGQVVIHFEDGRKVVTDLRYGADVRSIRDKRPTMAAPRQGTLSAVAIQIGGKAVKSVELVASNPAAGLRLHGVTQL